MKTASLINSSTKVTSSKFKKGDKVTCKKATPVYYSGYGGEPVRNFQPGEEGIVIDPDVPNVRRKGSFVLVGLDNGTKVRVALWKDNIVKVKGSSSNKQSSVLSKTLATLKEAGIKVKAPSRKQVLALSSGEFKFKRAVERGIDSFWEAVAKSFPEIKTGDQDPSDAVKFEKLCTEVVKNWYEGNT